MLREDKHGANLRRWRPREQGQSLLEFALVIPIFLVLVLGIIDFGLGLRAWISITNAAREGARVGAVRGTCDEIEQQVIDTSGGLVTSDEQIEITPGACDGGAGSSIVVTVSHEYELITPLGGLLSAFGGGVGLPSSIHIESTSDMRVE
jgi:hypothetical protein